MLTSYLQSLQLNVDKFSTCTYKLQIGYNIIIIVLVFTTQVTKLPPKCSHSHQKKKESLSHSPSLLLWSQRHTEHSDDGRQTQRHEATTEGDVCGEMT